MHWLALAILAAPLSHAYASPLREFLQKLPAQLSQQRLQVNRDGVDSNANCSAQLQLTSYLTDANHGTLEIHSEIECDRSVVPADPRSKRFSKTLHIKLIAPDNRAAIQFYTEEESLMLRAGNTHTQDNLVLFNPAADQDETAWTDFALFPIQGSESPRFRITHQLSGIQADQFEVHAVEFTSRTPVSH